MGLSLWSQSYPMLSDDVGQNGENMNTAVDELTVKCTVGTHP